MKAPASRTLGDGRYHLPDSFPPPSRLRTMRISPRLRVVSPLQHARPPDLVDGEHAADERWEGDLIATRRRSARRSISSPPDRRLAQLHLLNGRPGRVQAVIAGSAAVVIAIMLVATWLNR